MPGQLCRLLDVLERAKIILDGNPWAEPPESIVAKGCKSVRSYFEDLYAEPCRIERISTKVVLVGQEGAGKSRSVMYVMVLLLAATALMPHVLDRHHFSQKYFAVWHKHNR